MVLESLCHEQNCWVTLTYSNDYLPSDGSLHPAHARDWLKRFRKGLGNERVRYFLVGEYGEHTERPHYHACLFGQGVERGALISDTWGKGFSYTVEFNEYTAAYTAGYVVKKLTARDDIRLRGRHPEFSRMSLRPGIGAPAMAVLAEALDTDEGRLELRKRGDVPHQLKFGNKTMPLGKYLRRRLRQEVGLTDEQVQEAKDRFFEEKGAEMQLLLKRALDVTPWATVGSALVAENQGRIWSYKARAGLKRKGKL